MKNISQIKNFLLFLVVALFLSSCVSQKEIKYLQPVAEGDSTLVYEYAKVEDYRVKPNDNLYINIRSLDDKTSSFFNPGGSKNNSGNYYNEAGIYLNSYSVDDFGFIDFPFVGKVQVSGLTPKKIQEKVQTIVDEYLVESTITVKLVNFKITIMGEVQQPKELLVYQNQINIFEAFAMCGDLTTFADRGNIKLVRKEDGKAVIHELDLNKRSILSSEFFYLRPNDIIYIEPLKIKQFGFEQFPYGLVLSSITTILTLITFITVY